MKKTSYAQEERQFLKILLAIFVVGMLVVAVATKNQEKIQYQLDEAVENAYETGYEIGFNEGYDSINRIHIIEDWMYDIKVEDVIEEDGIGTIKLVDANGDLWILCYNAE